MGSMELMLAFLRGDHRRLTSLNYTQWLSLCKKFLNYGLLACSAPALMEVAPQPVCQRVEEFMQLHHTTMLRRLDALAAFSSIAQREHLHFALIKGMAAAKELYRDPFARQSGDIDILVTADDIPKADYVAREAGWLQPAEGFKVRRILGSGHVATEKLRNTQAPFSLRSSLFLPHVTNYFYVHKGGQVDSLEIHDRFYGIDSSGAGALLSDLRSVKLEGKRYSVLSRPAQALLSLLSLHEDAESVRANTSHAGDMGLKACVDVARWLEVLDDVELSELKSLVDGLGCSSLVARALGACIELFPSCAERAYALSKPMLSAWPLPYTQRLVNPDAALCANSQNMLAAVTESLADGHPVSYFSSEEWRRLPAYASKLPSGFAFKRRFCSDGVVLCSFLAPSGFSNHEDLVFQVDIGGAYADGTLGVLRAEASCCEGKWKAILSTVDARSLDSHVGAVHSGTKLGITGMPDGAGGLKAEIAINRDLVPFGEDLWMLPSAHLRNYASMFLPVAGWLLVDVAKEALNAGHIAH